MAKTYIILGNQLFPLSESPIAKGDRVFMAEDAGLCSHFRYHKHKLILFLAAMREYRDELRQRGVTVNYVSLKDRRDDRSYEEKLSEFLKEKKPDKVHLYEIEDKFFEKRIFDCFKERGVEAEVLPSKMFLRTRDEFREYLKEAKRPFMKTFYEQWRKESGVLMNKDGSPKGGKYSFDAENRKKLPKSEEPPPLPNPSRSDHVEAVSKLVEKEFSDHPGSVENFWLPVTRRSALAWLRSFLEERFSKFGPYEDAIAPESDFVYHSVLSPLLNLGLITPDEVLERALGCDVPIASKEGFVRQIAGWREFLRGIYQEYSEKQENENFWQHKRKIGRVWYEAETGIPPVDDAIQKAIRYGYNHHIERLMVLSNVMLLSELDPKEVHRWFMEMYVDSSDWVMGPNVYGMGQFSDGGIFATKPYTCGSNYILKMSSYKKGEWCDVLDGLYWSFIDKHKDFYSKNPRMKMMLGTLKKMGSEKKNRLFQLADDFREHASAA